MATTRAKAYSRATVKRAVEEYLEDGEALMSQHERKPSGQSYQHFQAQQYGAYNFARKLGFECMCTPHGKKKRAICQCDLKKAGIRQGHQILSGLKPFTFDGKHCRDKDGVFVPIPRCTGKRRKKSAA